MNLNIVLSKACLYKMNLNIVPDELKYCEVWTIKGLFIPDFFVDFKCLRQDWGQSKWLGKLKERLIYRFCPEKRPWDPYAPP